MSGYCLGGMTCDSDDYYNSEQNMNAIYLPKYNKERNHYTLVLILELIKKLLEVMVGFTSLSNSQPKHI
jgi:arginine decarboxylase